MTAMAGLPMFFHPQHYTTFLTTAMAELFLTVLFLLGMPHSVVGSVCDSDAGVRVFDSRRGRALDFQHLSC